MNIDINQSKNEETTKLRHITPILEQKWPRDRILMEYELTSGLGFVARAEKECDVYCPICHKLLHVEEGQVIPRCCGKVMEVME